MNKTIPPIEGTRPAVCVALEKSDLKPSAKAFAIELVESLAPKFNGAKVTAIVSEGDNIINAHITVSGKIVAG